MSPVDVHADTRAQLTAAWDVRGIEIATIVDDDATMRETRRRLVTHSPASETLPPLLSDLDGIPAAFELGRTLGEGGMGLVRAATQTSLRREVAIKSVRTTSSGRNASQLLREALVAGALEHPNIIPVHALGKDDAGQPMIVMKRVDGQGWDEALAEQCALRESDGYLKRHLDIFVNVAKAAHFAHQRGIVHRDIKPANVMLGADDDVYLVDWGIAVNLTDGGIRGVPVAADVRAIEGTPAYMSREMAAGIGEEIDARTDIYLLGATLLEALTGAPPHGGETLMDVLTEAFAGELPTYPDHVPDELRAICNRALARDIDDRYPNVQELIDDIELFFAHRASVRLTGEAEALLADLERLVDRIGELEEAELQSLYMTFSACRFAFSHALSTWSGNADAERGLTHALTVMIEVELARDHPEAAGLLVRELPEPSAELEASIARAQQHKQQKGDRLERFARDADLHVAARPRAALAVVIGALWCLAFGGLGALERTRTIVMGHAHLALLCGGLLVIVVVAAALQRHKLANRISRQQMFAMVALFVAYLGAIHVGWHFELSMPATSALMVLVGGVSFTSGYFFLDPALQPMIAALLGCLASIFIWPDWHLFFVGGFGGAGALLVARNIARTESVFQSGPAPSTRSPDADA